MSVKLFIHPFLNLKYDIIAYFTLPIGNYMPKFEIEKNIHMQNLIEFSNLFQANHRLLLQSLLDFCRNIPSNTHVFLSSIRFFSIFNGQ